MQLIGLAATFTLGLMLAPLAAEGHQSAKVPRIGHLSMLSRSDPTFRRLRDAFRQRLREHGYIEGQPLPLSGGSPKGDLSSSPSSRPS